MMAFPTLYIDTGGHAQGSGSTDSPTPIVSATSGAAVTGTTVTLTGADLSGVAADGSQTIFINDATNPNQKVFKITAVDDTLDTVTVDIPPSGTIVSSAWGIGGQFVYDSARFEAALVAGWTAVINQTPASKSTDFFTMRATGNATDGYITLRGKTGGRPQLVVTNTNQVIDAVSGGLWRFENLEFIQQGATGTCINLGAANGTVFDNCKISDAGGIGISASATVRITRCEITGCGSDAISLSGTGSIHAIVGCYIHDNTGKGIVHSGTSPGVQAAYNVIESNGGQGIHLSGATISATHFSLLIGNTIYGNGDSGLQIDDADTQVVMVNNIFAENGNAAGEYNVEWVAGSAERNSLHFHNVFFHSGGGGGENLSGLTAGSGELTTDPLFTNAASGDFSLGSSSPAKAAGYPGIILGGNTGYLDIGAVQRQEAGGGGLAANLSGGFVS